MIGNPVIARELRGALRARRSRVLAAVSLLGLAALVWWLWPEQGVFSLQAQASRTLVISIATMLTVMVLVCAPAFSSAALVSERENRSWELLLATRLSPWRIVTGKLIASTGMLLCYMTLSFPFLATAFALGALSPAEAARLYAVTAGTALFSGVAGLVISARAKSSHSALMSAFAWMSAWAGLPLVVHYLVRDVPALAAFGQWVRAVSPLSAAVSVLMGGDLPSAGGGLAVWQAYLSMIALAGVVLFLGLVVALYRRPPAPDHSRGGVEDNLQVLRRRRRRFPFYLLDPQRRRRGISDLVNPVFSRELRGRTLGGGVWMFRAMVGCFCASSVVVLLLAGRGGTRNPDGITGFAIAFQLGLILLVTPALTCGAITQEREGGRLDLLRLTRLGPAALLAGKAQVALIFIVLLVVSCFPLWLVVMAMDLHTASDLWRSWAVMGSTLVLSLCAGLAASTVARRTAVAAGLAYGLLGVVAVVTLFPYLAPARFSEAMQSLWMSANPFLAAFSMLEREGARMQPVSWLRHMQFSLGLTALLAVAAQAGGRAIFRPQR